MAVKTFFKGAPYQKMSFYAKEQASLQTNNKLPLSPACNEKLPTLNHNDHCKAFCICVKCIKSY